MVLMLIYFVAETVVLFENSLLEAGSLIEFLRRFLSEIGFSHIEVFVLNAINSAVAVVFSLSDYFFDKLMQMDLLRALLL